MPKALQRQQLRQLRQSLTPSFQREASLVICERLRHSKYYKRSQHVAFYLPMAGEVDVSHLLAKALEAGKQCYLPLIRPHQQLRFTPYRSGSTLARNSMGIAEPLYSRQFIQPGQLDLVITPLLGFDREGHRLGMGGGYYDRCFQHKQGVNRLRKPVLLGAAFACQELPQLEVATWDIDLNAIVTEQEWIRPLRPAAYP